jgi:2-keto-4-pentenoate hydratase/2-oxohepta-3-ene-1,7-dioic acid hydratase in catechol pathway
MGGWMMRFVTAEKDGQTFVGLINETMEYVLDLKKAEEAKDGNSDIPNSLIECIEKGEQWLQKIDALEAWASAQKNTGLFRYPRHEVKLLAPIPRPRKNIFCVGKNYVAHALELGTEEDIPEHIMLFSKTPTTVIGPEEPILRHADVTNELDYEGELAVVIGKQGKAISEQEALNYVFGYTIINDVTARDLQDRHKQFLLGKSLDSSCPMGPYIIHRSLIPNPNELHIETKVNGETRQKANTKQFIFPIETIISVISRGMTLEPGDIIATGTPAGVGKGYKPPRYLKTGDVVEITIEGIGTLKNQVQD